MATQTNPRSLANLIPIKPGHSGNPAGRKTAGACLKEWINVMSEKNLTVSELRKIARDKKGGWVKRAAAERIIRTMEAPDLADFEEAVDGDKKLSDLRKGGVNTEAVKKMKTRRRIIPQEGGEPITEVERELELHDRAGADFDRIMDRTEGKPNQAITGADGKPMAIKFTFDLGTKVGDKTDD